MKGVGKLYKKIIAIMILVLIWVFSVGCSSEENAPNDQEVSTNTQQAAEESSAEPALSAEHVLCDVKIIEQMSGTGGTSGRTYFQTVVQIAYVDYNGTIQYQIKPISEVQIQQEPNAQSRLVRYEGDSTIYLCLTPDLYNNLF